MNSFYEHHKDSINWHYHCFDRIFLNGLIQPFQQPERLICQHLSPRRATPRSLVHTDVSDHAWPQADAATVTIQPQQARTRGKIPIAPAAPPPHTSRDFVPWRFLDAGRKSAWKGSSCRRPKTCTGADISSVAGGIDGVYSSGQNLTLGTRRLRPVSTQSGPLPHGRNGCTRRTSCVSAFGGAD